MEKQIATINGRQVWITAAELATLDRIEECRKGGFATVHGYIPNDRTTDKSASWIEAPVQDIQFLSRFSYSKLAARKLALLETLSLDTPAIREAIAADPKLSAASEADLQEAWADRIERARNTVEKLQPGADRTDAHRMGHDADYWTVTEGVKVHFETQPTEIVVDGKTKKVRRPILTDGLPTVDAIMLSTINIKTTAREGHEGVRHVPNSGVKVLLGNAIDKVLNQPGLAMRTISLKPGRWESISIDTHKILNEDVHDNVTAIAG